MIAVVAVNYTTMRNNFKNYCDLATDHGEAVIVTRKSGRNVVVMSIDRYNEMEKEIQNARYLAKLGHAFAQLHEGKGQPHELIED